MKCNFVIYFFSISFLFQPLQQVEWFGNPRGYNITYTEISTGKSQSATIEDHTANSHVIIGLEEFALYEISMQACNDVGSSQPSPRALERTRESGMLNFHVYFTHKKNIT